MALGLGQTIITFTPSTTIASSDMNSNLAALNTASSPTFSTVSVGDGTTAYLTIDGFGTAVGTGIAAPSSPSLALAAGSTLGVGVYKYVVTYTSLSGESQSSSTSLSITTTSGNQKVNLTSIPIGPAGATGRNVYRTKVGASTYFLLTNIADNVTTTYTDTTADASLPATTLPAHPSLGGDIWKTSGGTVVAEIASDGAISSTAPVQLLTGNQLTNIDYGLNQWYGATGTNMGSWIAFPVVLTNTPTSIALSVSSSTNVTGSPQANAITKTGFIVVMTCTSIGRAVIQGQYTTSGNCLQSVDEVNQTFTHHCEFCGTVSSHPITALSYDLSAGSVPGKYPLGYVCALCGASETYYTGMTSSDEQDPTPDGDATRGERATAIRAAQRLLGLPTAA